MIRIAYKLYKTAQTIFSYISALSLQPLITYFDFHIPTHP